MICVFLEKIPPMAPRRSTRTKNSAFVDAGQFSADESSGDDLHDFICHENHGEDAIKPLKKRLRKKESITSSSEACDPDILDDEEPVKCQRRVLAESSDDDEEKLPRKRRRLQRRQSCLVNSVPDSVNDEVYDSDCPRVSAVRQLDSEDSIEFQENKGGGLRAAYKNQYCLGDSDSEGDEMRSSGKEAARVDSLDSKLADSDDGSGGDLNTARNRRRKLRGGKPAASLVQQIMQNRGKLLGRLSEEVCSSSTSSSGSECDDSDSQELEDFIVDDPSPASRLGGAEDHRESVSKDDLCIDIRKLPQLEIFRIYVDFLMRMDYDEDFQADFTKNKLDNRDCRIQAANKIEAEICDLMDWAVESASQKKELLEQLRTRPCMEVVAISSVTHCQVCNRRRNLATYRVSLHGAPCSSEWIVTRPGDIGKHAGDFLECSSESEESEAGDLEDFTVAVGKFCCCRMRLYHGMTHFKRRVSQYMHARIEKQMELSGKSWEDCLLASLDSNPLIERLLGHYTSLVSIARDYITNSRSQVEYVHAKLYEIEESLDVENVELDGIEEVCVPESGDQQSDQH